MTGIRHVEVEERVSELERRLQVIEDIEAIKRLKARYASLCDQGYEPDALASLFTDDAVWDGAVFGTFNGREEIRRFFAGVSSKVPWAFHLMIAPEITVAPDGLNASGRWCLFAPSTMRDPDRPGLEQPVLQMATYEDRYQKVGGAWRFSEVKVHYEAVTNLHEGWVARRFRS